MCYANLGKILKVATWIIMDNLTCWHMEMFGGKKIEFTLREGINYEAQTLESKTDSVLLTYLLSLTVIPNDV